MTRLRSHGLAPIFAACLAVGLTLPASAQSGPPLPSMPMPPSAGDPAPKETGKKAQPKKAPAKKKQDGAELGDPATPRLRTPPTAASSPGAAARPQRYVPEEFDRGRSEEPRAKPIVTEGGRPGMGMRF